MSEENEVRFQKYLATLRHSWGPYYEVVPGFNPVRVNIIRKIWDDREKSPAATAWAVFGPDGEIHALTLNKGKERPFALGKIINREFEKHSYTCERVKITRLGKEGE